MITLVISIIIILVISTVTSAAVGVQGLEAIGLVSRTKTTTPKQAEKHQYNPEVVWNLRVPHWVCRE